MANKGKGTSKLLGLDFHDMEQMQKRFQKIGADIKPAAERALKKSHNFVTKRLEQHTTKPFMPAGGKFSEGETKKSIVHNDKVYWIGSNAYIPIGYDVSKTINSIFLMYGTPKMKPNKEMYKDIFGRDTRRMIREIQEETMFDVLEELKGG